MLIDVELGLSTVHTSKSRVTNVDPCSMPAKPPTITKSISASHRRSISWLSFTTQLSSDALQFERGLMLYGAFIVRVAETRLDQAHIDAGALGLFDRGAHCKAICTLGRWRARLDSNQ